MLWLTEEEESHFDGKYFRVENFPEFTISVKSSSFHGKFAQLFCPSSGSPGRNRLFRLSEVKVSKHQFFVAFYASFSFPRTKITLLLSAVGFSLEPKKVALKRIYSCWFIFRTVKHSCGQSSSVKLFMCNSNWLFLVCIEFSTRKSPSLAWRWNLFKQSDTCTF